jgi:YHS domain-containing protein
VAIIIKVSEQDIISVNKALETKYKEKGKNYFFKSKKISKEFGITPYIVGRVAMKEAMNGGPVKLILKPIHGVCLFKTAFD